MKDLDDRLNRFDEDYGEETDALLPMEKTNKYRICLKLSSLKLLGASAHAFKPSFGRDSRLGFDSRRMRN